MSRPGLLATIAVAATVLLTVAVQTVRAQSQQSAASSFASGQQSTLTAPSTSTPSSSVVPGYAGDATNLQSYSDNPTGLQNAGQTAALTDPSMALTQQGIAKRNANAVDINADWLKASLGTSIDPMAGAQGPAGTDSSSCKAITKTASTTSTSMYTCETSRQVTDTAYQCPAKLVMDVQQILTYPCTKTYDQATKTWVVSTQCLALGGSGNCTLQGETCTTPGQPYYENRNCTAGSQWTSTTKTCNQDRQVTIDTDYVYQCTAGSSACTALGRECSLTSSVCGAVTPPTYQTKSCQDGSTTSTSSASCSETRVVVVTGGPQNTYSCTEGYSGSSYPATCGSSLNVSVFPVYKYGYYLPGALEYGYNPLDACSNTYTENQSDGWYFEYDCDGPVSGSPWRGSMWLIAVAGVEGGDSWSYDGGACIGESRGCRRTDHVCTGGSGTRTINGVAVTRSCWGYTDSYQCDQTTSAPGCSVPSGYQLQSSSCSGYTNGSCTQYNKTYVDPNSGKQVSSEYWQSNCGSIGGNCSYNGSSVTEGGGTRNINGLDVYRDSWAVQKNYTCSSSQSVNTCGSTSGCSETGRSCANSGCTLYNVTYSCMTSPGSCSRTDNTYACEEQVAGGGSPTSTTKSVATDCPLSAPLRQIEGSV